MDLDKINGRKKSPAHRISFLADSADQLTASNHGHYRKGVDINLRSCQTFVIVEARRVCVTRQSLCTSSAVYHWSPEID